MAQPKPHSIAAIKGLYRSLIREVNKQVTIRNGNCTWLKFVRNQFNTSLIQPKPNVQDTTTTRGLLLSAQNTLLYLSSSRIHQTMLDKYSARSSDENAINKSAARVGLQLPKSYSECKNI